MFGVWLYALTNPPAIYEQLRYLLDRRFVPSLAEPDARGSATGQ